MYQTLRTPTEQHVGFDLNTKNHRTMFVCLSCLCVCVCVTTDPDFQEVPGQTAARGAWLRDFTDFATIRATFSIIQYGWFWMVESASPWWTFSCHCTVTKKWKNTPNNTSQCCEWKKLGLPDQSESSCCFYSLYWRPCVFCVFVFPCTDAFICVPSHAYHSIADFLHPRRKTNGRIFPVQNPFFQVCVMVGLPCWNGSILIIRWSTNIKNNMRNVCDCGTEWKVWSSVAHKIWHHSKSVAAGKYSKLTSVLYNRPYSEQMGPRPIEAVICWSSKTMGVKGER